MYCCYILKSIKNGKYYTGSTSNFVDRLKNHNKGLVKSTKHNRPWELKYIEYFGTLSKANKRERQIKKWKKRVAIERLINKI